MRASLFSSAVALLLTSLATAPVDADTLTHPYDLGALGGTYTYSYAISADGSTVVGRSYTAGDHEYRAYRWTASGGIADLGTLGGTWSDANGVSADGSTVVGNSYIAGNSASHAFRWTQSAGMADLGTLGGTDSSAYAVSADGSAVVGNSYIAGNSASHAFRWTQSAGMADLGTLGGTDSYANAVSADGSVVVGDADLNGDTETHAFRWTQAGGMVDLGTLGTGSWASAVSADGSSVVGWSYLVGSSGAFHAFRWTESTGMADLGTLGTGTRSYANSVSADGSSVVGWSYLVGSSGAFHAFRWTSSTGMVDLGTLSGTRSEASAVSADGSVVVGTAYTTGDSETRAFRWTQATGLKDLNALLADAGVSMAGITLWEATAISANGKYIVGNGTFSGVAYPVIEVVSPANPTAHGAFLVCYDPDNGCIGLTTGQAQANSAQKLSDDRRSMMVQNRAAANELLGMSLPMKKDSHVRAGAMFGSAMGYVAGQASLGGLTVLGGLGYGHQSYNHIDQDDALTAAVALRYTFLKKASVHPFVEFGGWATPEETLTMSRSYLNGSSMTYAHGSTDASSFAGYARGGLIWDASPHDQLVGYEEFGRQYLSVSSYVETPGLFNPFPASVDGGLLWMNVARAGLSWTHDLGTLILASGQPMSMSFTLAGAAAHSLVPHTGLRATLAGADSVATLSHEDTWGEFGARLSARLTNNLSFGLDMSSVSGVDPVGTSFHGGASLAFAF